MSPPPPKTSTENSLTEFSPEERTLLIRLAHDSVSTALERGTLALDPPTPHLSELRGVFTSLYLPGGSRENSPEEKELRGCVGYVRPTFSVYRAVAETARGAAFEDHRFAPVTGQEAPHLLVELSILSPPRAIRPEEIQIGRHGLLITGHGRRGLLLPQVPIERNWDRITFLEQTCRKAGLPVDAWQKGATIEGFTAEVFGEASGQ